MRKVGIILMTGLVFVFSTCKKDPESPSNSSKFEYGLTTIDSVAYHEAIITTLIINLGGNTVMQYGHCWDTVSAPDINDHLTTSNGNPSNLNITSNITGLKSARQYFMRAYCKLRNTTVYSSEVEVITLKTGKPLVGFLNISELKINSAKCDAVILSDSGLTVTERGVCWDTVNIFTLSDCLDKMTSGTGTGQFTCQLSNLQEGRNYFIKAYAVNLAGINYGELRNFQTLPITIPEVITAEVSQITSFTALCGGEVISTGNGTVNIRGICWNDDPEVFLANSLGSTQQGSGMGVYYSTMSGLEAGKFYYVRSYATNEKGTAYGEERSFQTVSINLPTVTTAEVTNVTSTSAKCGGTVVNSGNGTVSARGVCWGLNSDVTLTNCQAFTTNGTGTGSFTSDVTGLTAGNTYYVRAYATNENGTGYGGTQVINTPSIPTVTTTEVTSITTTTAISGGEVTFDGFGTVSGRGICWGTSPNPSLGNCLGYTNDGSGIGSYTSLINGLSPATLYYVRAYAINETGTGYGDLKSFLTAAIGVPTVITANITNITITTATGGGDVTDNGSGTVITKGICWGYEPNPTVEDALGITNNGSGLGNYVSQLTGLTAGTLYYVRAYATNEAGTGYGDLKSFTTLNIMIPDVTTAEVINITTNSAQSGGEVISGNNGTVSARGVCWNTRPNPSLTDNLGFTTNGTGLGTFISNLSGLALGTVYYVRAYASNEAGTGYGEEEEFTTTSVVLPSVTTESVTDITQTTATSGGNVISDGGVPVTVRGICWSDSPNPTTGDSYSTDGSGIGTFTSYLTGLAENTLYYVRAYATNDLGTAYGNEMNFTTLLSWSCGDSLTIDHIEGNISPVTKTVTYGTVTNVPGETSKCWITSNLGANHQATTVDDATEESAGWYWQFNRKQGYKHDGINLTPAWTITIINENSNWLAANDPCTLELGDGWRLPISTEWYNVDANGNWTDWNGPWNSALKMHAAGYLNIYGSLGGRGLEGRYWCSIAESSTHSLYLYFSNIGCFVHSEIKALGYSVKCLRD